MIIYFTVSTFTRLIIVSIINRMYDRKICRFYTDITFKYVIGHIIVAYTPNTHSVHEYELYIDSCVCSSFNNFVVIE